MHYFRDDVRNYSLQAKPKTGIDGGYDPSWRSFVSMTDATSGDLTTAKIKAASGYLRSGHYTFYSYEIFHQAFFREDFPANGG